MPGDFNKVVSNFPRVARKDYHVLMKTLNNAFSFDLNDAAKSRYHILTFFYAHGRRATLDAYSIKQSTLYDWKKAYERSGKRLSSLIPKSTRPHRTRMMTTDPRLELFIKAMREDFGNFSKAKIKPFLAAYAKSLGLPGYSATKIQKIINRRHYYFEGRIKRRKARIKPLSARVKRSPRETLPGYIELDSITVYINSRKYYFVTAIDVVTKFAWCKLVTALSSRQALLALKEFIRQYGRPIRVIQTDNGASF